MYRYTYGWHVIHVPCHIVIRLGLEPNREIAYK